MDSENPPAAVQRAEDRTETSDRVDEGGPVRFCAASDGPVSGSEHFTAHKCGDRERDRPLDVEIHSLLDIMVVNRFLSSSAEWME